MAAVRLSDVLLVWTLGVPEWLVRTADFRVVRRLSAITMMSLGRAASSGLCDPLGRKVADADL